MASEKLVGLSGSPADSLFDENEVFSLRKKDKRKRCMQIAYESKCCVVFGNSILCLVTFQQIKKVFEFHLQNCEN